MLILTDLGVVSSPGFAEVDQAVFAELQKSTYRIELYHESLELNLFPDEVSQKRFREHFIQKYLDRRPDLIIAAGSASLQFIAESHETFLRETPIVFCGILGDLPDPVATNMHLTGVLGKLRPEETLKVALQLLPRTKQVVVVGGMGKFDAAFEDVAKRAFHSYESKLEFIYLTNLTMPALLERLRHLPNDTIVYHTAITLDAAGERFIDSPQSVPLVASAANAPVFVMDDVDLTGGAVGGDLVNWADDGRVAAEMAVRVLKGERPEDIPIVTSDDAFMFDWRALQRWGLKESNLPPGSIILNRPPSFWQVYKRYILAGSFVILAQAVAILALLRQRARKRKAEAELTRSEEKFAKTFRQSPLVLAISRTSDSSFIEVNESFEEQVGWKRNEIFGRTAPELNLWVDAGQRATFVREIQTKGSVRNLEALICRRDGAIRTFLVSAEVIDVSGQLCTLSVGTDITERKQAEAMLSGISSRLIEAHEEERTWIARELHDDINQRIALLAVNLSIFEENPPRSETVARLKIEEIKTELTTLGTDVQALSHRLHSSKLDYLGLETAAGGFCKELSERQSVEVEFDSDNVPSDLSKEISLCVFRVLQEALHNAVKYSGVPKFQVSLKVLSNDVELSVHDSGVGFDPAKAINGHGLGLTSMKERLKLVHGQLSIDSKPGHGTTVRARVPLKATAAGADG